MFTNEHLSNHVGYMKLRQELDDAIQSYSKKISEETFHLDNEKVKIIVEELGEIVKRHRDGLMPTTGKEKRPVPLVLSHNEGVEVTTKKRKRGDWESGKQKKIDTGCMENERFNTIWVKYSQKSIPGKLSNRCKCIQSSATGCKAVLWEEKSSSTRTVLIFGEHNHSISLDMERVMQAAKDNNRFSVSRG